MTIKKKAPAPFVAAGTHMAVTPDLTSRARAISDIGNVFYEKAYNNLRQARLEEGDIAGSNFVKYDDKGNLLPLESLPGGTSYYEQAFRKSAKINYLNALKINSGDLSTKYLLENPFDVKGAADYMDEIIGTYHEDMPEDFVGDATLILNETKANIVNHALNNKLIKNREDNIFNALDWISRESSEGYLLAEQTNRPFQQFDKKNMSDSFDILIANGAKDWGEERKVNELKLYEQTYNLHRNLYKLNKILYSFDATDEGNNFKTLEEFDLLRTKIRNSLSTQVEKDAWDKLSHDRYTTHIQSQINLQKVRNSAESSRETADYENFLMNILPNLSIEDRYIPPNLRGEFRTELGKKYGGFNGELIWNSNYKNVNSNFDKGSYIEKQFEIYSKIQNEEEGYGNYHDVYNKHISDFTNPLTGNAFKGKIMTYFLNEHMEKMKSKTEWLIHEFQDDLVNKFILTNGTNYHFTKERSVVREHIKSFINKQLKIDNTKWKPSHLASMMAAWDKTKELILDNESFRNIAYRSISLNLPFNKEKKARDWYLGMINDESIDPRILNADQMRSEVKKMMTLNTAHTTMGMYLINASNLPDEYLEKLMPALDEIFNNPNKGRVITLKKNLREEGVDLEFLEDFYKGYRVNDNSAQLGREYAVNEKDNMDNTKRDKAKYYQSIEGKTFWWPRWLGGRKDIEVKDEASLIEFMKFRLNDNLHDNKGFLDAWLLSGVADWNDPRYRPIVLMMDAINDDLGDGGISFDELQHQLDDDFWNAVEESVHIIWSGNPKGFAKSKEAMNNVLDKAIAHELGNWYPESQPNPDGDPNSPPIVNWVKNSVIHDAMSTGGWEKAGWQITPDVISGEIASKLIAADIQLPKRLTAEEVGWEFTKEKWTSSWLDVDFHVQYSHTENGFKRYSIWYYDQFGMKTQIMADNKDDTRSALYWDYNYSNSMVAAAEEMFYKRQNDKSITFGKKVDKIIDDIWARGWGDLSTNKDIEIFRRIIPSFIHGGEINHIYKNMLINQQRKDTVEAVDQWFQDNLGSYISSDTLYYGLSIDSFRNAGLKRNLNLGR